MTVGRIDILKNYSFKKKHDFCNKFLTLEIKL